MNKLIKKNHAPGVKCPQCVNGNSAVINSGSDGENVVRRRQCLTARCGYEWTTLELDMDTYVACGGVRLFLRWNTMGDRYISPVAPVRRNR